jgi:putative acyl-CoA dehydrogenase
MRNVLADLAIDSEAATTVVMRIAGAVERAAHGDAAEKQFRRVALAVTKYFLCKRLASHTVEALECLGGNGYVEESGMPRLYREAPLISIWEGSGNVAALDTLRAMGREPETIEAFFGELDLAAGADPRYDDALAMVRKQFTDLDELQYRARRIVEQMAMLLQASLLLRHGPAEVADAFVASRLAGDWGVAYGTLPTGVDTEAILERARVQ